MPNPGFPPTIEAAWAGGYQDALDDIARVILDSDAPASSRAALQWCERNMHASPRRILVSAALLRMSTSGPYDY